MVLLASEALGIVEHALGGEVHSKVTGLRCLNGAGRWLCSARSWRFLRGGADALPLVAGQSWVGLPSDFGGVVSIEGGQGWSSAVEAGSLADILALRSQGGGYSGSNYVYAVVYDHADITGTSSTTGHTITPTTAAESKALKKPTPRLEIYPTPQTADTDGVFIYYRRGWRTLLEDTDTVFVPEWCEELYLEAARIWAKGYEYTVGSAQTYSRDRALAELQMGPTFKAAQRQDSKMQPTLGRIEGGAAQVQGQVWVKPWYRQYSPLS